MIKESRWLKDQRRKRRRKLWVERIVFLLIILVVVFGGRWLYRVLSPQPIPAPTPPSNNPQGIDTLKAELESYLKDFQGQYGIYYYNIATGEEFGINDTEEYTAASTTKIPLNLYLYTQIKKGAVDPQGTLTYLKSDYEDGTGKIRYEKVGNSYTIAELSKLSIEISDNVAANMLIRFLGDANIKQYMRQVGGVVVQEENNVSSPRDMGLYMKLIYEFSTKEGELGQNLMNCFLNTQFNDRIPALLPETVKVAHKIGNQIRAVNDVGIVFTDSPYILSIMSKDVNEEEAATVLPNISKKVYDVNTSK